MALSSSLSLSLFFFIFVSVQWTRVYSESTISASPAVLPYINAPDMSSFFPSPTKNRPVDKAISPVPEAEAPDPNSGMLNGKIAGSSMRLCPDLSFVRVIVGICSFLYVLYWCCNLCGSLFVYQHSSFESFSSFNLTNFNICCYSNTYVYAYFIYIIKYNY